MTMKISEVMTTEVETIGADQTAREAASFMLRADAGSIPVCDGDKVISTSLRRNSCVIRSRAPQLAIGPPVQPRD